MTVKISNAILKVYRKHFLPAKHKTSVGKMVCFIETTLTPSTKSSRPGAEWKVISLLCYCQRRKKSLVVPCLSAVPIPIKPPGKIPPLYQPCSDGINILLEILTATHLNDKILLTILNKISG